MIRVYVASPYSIGDAEENVRRNLEAADLLMDFGFAPYAPLLNHYQHQIRPRSYDDWLRLDMEWLAQCRAVLRLPGESRGADLEVARAQELGIPVFYDIDLLVGAYQ